MTFEEKCQMDNCTNIPTRLAARPEGGIIDICDDCYFEYFKS